MREAPLQRTRHYFSYNFRAFGRIVRQANPTIVGFLLDPFN
jgi:hypothetical protein